MNDLRKEFENDLREQFEKETGESYNDYFCSAVFYSDKYVEWLENKVLKLENIIYEMSFSEGDL
jgi:hypothetical protein